MLFGLDFASVVDLVQYPGIIIFIPSLGFPENSTNILFNLEQHLHTCVFLAYYCLHELFYPYTRHIMIVAP